MIIIEIKFIFKIEFAQQKMETKRDCLFWFLSYNNSTVSPHKLQYFNQI